MTPKGRKGHSTGARPLGVGLLLAGLAGLGLPQLAGADENFFGYSEGWETAPKGSWEFYQWVTWRHSKGEGTYDALDLRTELEYGITDRLQGSFYLNTAYHKTQDTGPIDEETGLREIPNQDSFGFQG